MNTDTTVSSNPANIANDTSVNKPAANMKNKKGKVSSVMMSGKDKAIKMEVDKEGYYNGVEMLPVYPGGQAALDKFINDNVDYPTQAIDRGTEATVIVGFGIDENGKVTNPHVVGAKAGYGLDEEAVRVIGKMPMWTPGSIKGKNVKSNYSLPLRFQLSE